MSHLSGSMAPLAVTQAEIPRSPKKEAKYIPPPASGKVLLSEALHGTDRLPEPKQSTLLGKDRDSSDRADLNLYFAGDLSLLRQPCVAIVGTRKVSDAGAQRTRRLARKLVDAGVVVVSGLAYGVDTVAHTTAIAFGGRTVAVIGTPLDKASPAENRRLQETIYREHLLISQFPEGTTVYRASFPQRNKLMASLTDATVVMEASDSSGTLHQAAECTRLGRWLFIAKSVVDDPSFSWPKKFLKYETCMVLEKVEDVTGRVLRQRG